MKEILIGALFITIVLLVLLIITYAKANQLKAENDRLKKNAAMLHAKKGDWVYIPHDCEINGIGLYRVDSVSNKPELIQKTFISK